MKSLMVIASLLLFNNIFGQEQKNYTEAIKEIFPDYEHPKAWTEPFPSFRIVGNLYGVGSYDLSTFIITSDQGHILINTGVEGSLDEIQKNLKSIKVELEDVKLLLSMQAHFDHVADLAIIKEITGAKMLATIKDARILEDGGFSDPHFGGAESFQPISVDQIISEGDVISLGDINLRVHEHPGHTEGSSSYSFQIKENEKTYNVLIANMGTINPGKQLISNPTYEGVAKDFNKTYSSQKNMDVDIWVAAHGSQYGLHDKFKPGQPYSPETFVDPNGLIDAVEKLEIKYIKQINSELKDRNNQTH
jgi:metallo-beta-lactamase class B